MPGTSKLLTVAQAPQTSSQTIDVDTGRLRAVAIEVPGAAINSAQVYVRVGLQRTAVTGGPVFAILAQGYVGFWSQLSWTGDINLEADMRVFVIGQAHAATDIILSVYTEQ